MPGYLQEFDNRLYDRSTQIEMLEHQVDEQFRDVIARMEQIDMRGERIESKLDTLLRHFPSPR